MPEGQNDQDVKEQVAKVATDAVATSATGDQSGQADAAGLDRNSQSHDTPEEAIDWKAKYEAEKAARIAERTRLKRKAQEHDARSRQEAAANPVSDAEKYGIDQSKFEYDPVRIAAAVFDAKEKEKAQIAAQAKQSEEFNARLSAFDQKVAEFAAKHPEYDAILQSKGSESYGDPTIDQAVLEEDSPALDYFLSHPENAATLESLKGLPEYAKVRELVKLAASAEQWAATKRKGATKTVTSAPAPARVATGKGGRVPPDPRYDPNLSMADYIAYSNGQK